MMVNQTSDNTTVEIKVNDTYFGVVTSYRPFVSDVITNWANTTEIKLRLE